jgi:hypothetical protein
MLPRRALLSIFIFIVFVVFVAFLVRFTHPRRVVVKMRIFATVYTTNRSVEDCLKSQKLAGKKLGSSGMNAASFNGLD